MNPAERDATRILRRLARQDRAVSESLTVRSFEAGETVCKSWDTANSLYLVVSGRVQLFRTTRNKRRLAVATLGPGSMLGEESWLGGTQVATYAVALERCILWAFPTQRVRELSSTNAMFGFGLMQAMGQRLMEAENRLEQVAFNNVASRLAAYVDCFAPHLAAASIVGTSGAGISGALASLTSPELVQGFSELVRGAGLESCVVLVDGLDEFPRTANDPDQAVALLAPLLGTLSLIENPGLAFRFFLPQELEPTLRDRGWFRVDRLHISRIAWKDSKILALIRQRLTHFSDREPPYEDVAQLCTDELARLINDELVALATGSPRAALILGNMLLQSHCQQPNPLELIALETWRQVKTQWPAHREDFVMEEGYTTDVRPEGARPGDAPVLRIEEERHLVWLGSHDITSEIGLQDYRVLVCLYQYQDRVCTKDLLVETAWPQATKEGVADQAIAASIARLRRMLRQYAQGVEYIETIRGHGYRLHPGGIEA